MFYNKKRRSFWSFWKIKRENRNTVEYIVKVFSESWKIEIVWVKKKKLAIMNKKDKGILQGNIHVNLGKGLLNMNLILYENSKTFL